MRNADEVKAWRTLIAAAQGSVRTPFAMDDVELNLADPCIVVGGRNGSGKSRLLRSLANHLGERSLLLDLHALCEMALAVLRSRSDFEEMRQEVSQSGPSAELREHVDRVVARNYDKVEWYSYELTPSRDDIADRFRWRSSDPIVPYFRVSYRGHSYSATDMGLGELSVHLLFWILDQYREEDDVTLLLDEPDAYLPPVGSSLLLYRLVALCRSRKWRMIVATHSSEIIAEALSHESFVMLQVGDLGRIEGTHCLNDPTAADTLLARPPIRRILFVEDESASSLARALLNKIEPRSSQTTEIVWGNGAGYLIQLEKYLPGHSGSAIKFAYVFDGDQRRSVKSPKSAPWPALFLPTDSDPDTLMLGLARAQPAKVATRIGVSEPEFRRFLATQEGADAHDGINSMGQKYGRLQVLSSLANLWVDDDGNSAEVLAFQKHLQLSEPRGLGT